MKKIIFLIIISLVLVSFISSPLLAATRGIRITTKAGESLFLYKDYHALVIGVSDYQKWPKLPNAVNDAKEVASKLGGLGFEVKTVLNPTSREMKRALNEMVYTMGTEEDRALLLYYAGHGETETLADTTKMGYIIPKDCPLLKKDPLGFAATAISMRDIESTSLRIHSKHVMMLFDSCFSGSLFALVRAVPDDITEKSAYPVRQYITAGREDEQVPDRSMFKRCLLIGLEGDADLTGDGYITGSELGMYLSDNVVNYTKRGQHPQYGKINNPSLDRGDFIFASFSLEFKLKATEERLRKEIAEKKALEEELKKLRTAMGKTSRFPEKPREKQTQEKRLASIPKAVTDDKIYKVNLRDTPEELWNADVKKMIEKHNFFEKNMNEEGDFPNDFVDNGDETITNRVTGLMWEKGGSSRILHFSKAKKYVSRLNREMFAGYNDWRIPTLEELCSLLEQKVNERGKHISSLFKDTQSKCLSTDRFGGGIIPASCISYSIVNFRKGKIDEIATKDPLNPYCQSMYYYIRAVRTIK
jgi:hypothetical protein